LSSGQRHVVITMKSTWALLASPSNPHNYCWRLWNALLK